MLRLEWVPKVVLDQRWKVRTKVQNLVWGHSPKKENKKKKQKSWWRLLGSNIHTVQHNQNEESSRSCEKICCSTEIMGVTRGKENNRLMFVIVQLLLMKYLKMYYLLENEWRVLWQFYTQFTTAGAVTDSKRTKYSNPTKTQNICMFANQQGKKRSTKQFQKTSVTH